MMAFAELSTAKLFLLMLLLHVFSDFSLQGLFGKLKQQSFWEKQCQKAKWARFEVMYRKYGRDYIPALVLHGIYWSLITFAPIVFSRLCPDAFALAVVFVQGFLHALIDHMKCNRPLRLNLIQDQSLHVLQIASTLAAWVLWVRPLSA